VAVLITKALIEIPPKFSGMPPVNPEARKKSQTTLKGAKEWKGVEGLAEDVRYYLGFTPVFIFSQRWYQVL